MISTVDMEIWGRMFSVKVKFRCHSGEKVSVNQIAAFEKFVSKPQWIKNAKKQVEDFCKVQVEEDSSNQKKDNIFSYVRPDYIFVDRSDVPNVAIMLNYRYDEEHGLAVVFDHNGNVTVGLQDIIL